MYYKLPVKERMELMKSYKKTNPNMSYSDMVKDYNDSYQKFKDGGKKEINLNFPQSEYTPPVSTWNQNVDWLGEKYNDVGLNFNKNNLNIGIGNYVPRSTFEKVGNINPYLNMSYDLNDKNSIGGNFSKDYNGVSFIHKFGNGGKKEVEPYQPKSQADYLFRQKMYNDSLALGKYSDIQKILEPKNSNFDYMNPDPINKKNQGLLQNYAAKIIKENPGITYQMEEGIPYKGEYGKLPEKVGEYNPNLASPDLYHPIIKPTGQWEGAANNDTYVKPVQKILPFKKDETSNTLTKTNTIVKDETKKPINSFKSKSKNPPAEIPPIIPPIVNSAPVKKDTIQYIPKQPVINSDTIRHWNFNGPNPTLEYYDKSNKLIKKEFYNNAGPNKKLIKSNTINK